MKTDDRTTRQPNGAEGDEAKVVRLSDWLASDDELVPFGPRARGTAHEPGAGHADSHAESPAATGFWEGDTSVHTAVPGPELFGQTGDRPAEHQRRSVPSWRPALPPFHPFGWGRRAREAIADLVVWISWPWAVGGVAFVSLVVVLLLALLGGSSGHRDLAARASIGDQQATLAGTLGETGTAASAAAVADLRQLPRVTTAGRTAGTAAARAGALQARRRRHAVAASSSASGSTASTASTTGSVSATTTSAATVTTRAPTESEPTQTAPAPAPTSGGGASSSSGGSSNETPKQPAFGANAALGPGSSPNG